MRLHNSFRIPLTKKESPARCWTGGVRAGRTPEGNGFRVRAPPSQWGGGDGCRFDSAAPRQGGAELRDSLGARGVLPASRAAPPGGGSGVGATAVRPSLAAGLIPARPRQSMCYLTAIKLDRPIAPSALRTVPFGASPYRDVLLSTSAIQAKFEHAARPGAERNRWGSTEEFTPASGEGRNTVLRLKKWRPCFASPWSLIGSRRGNAGWAGDSGRRRTYSLSWWRVFLKARE